MFRKYIWTLAIFISAVFLVGCSSDEFIMQSTTTIYNGSVNMSGNIIPALNQTYTLGNITNQWNKTFVKDLFISGSVGIGTNIPSYVLDVLKNNNSFVRAVVTNLDSGASARAGVSAVSDSGGINIMQMSQAFITVPAWTNDSVLAFSGQDLWIHGTDGDSPNIIFALNTSSSTGEKMRLTSAGNLGVGNTNPSSRLTVTTTASNIVARFEADALGGNATLRLRSTLTNSNNMHGDIVVVPTSTSADVGYIGLRVPYTASIPPLIVNNLGNVGIGTVVPGALLHINSTGTINSFNRDILISGTLSSINASRCLAFTNANINNLMASICMTTDAVGNQGELKFATATSTLTNATERMRIDNGGNVGIGTTTPSNLLTLYGATMNLSIDNTAETEFGISFRDAQDFTQRGEFIYDAGTNLVKIKNNGVSAMVVDLAGNSNIGNNALYTNYTSKNIGIGTTTPFQKLDVVGTLRLNSTNIMDLSPGGAGTFDRLDFKAGRLNLGSSFQLVPNGNNQRSKMAVSNRNDTSNFGSAYIGVDNSTAYFSLQNVGSPLNNVTTLVIGSSANLGGTNWVNITIPHLAGTGNDYMCVNANGTLYRSDLGCT